MKLDAILKMYNKIPSENIRKSLMTLGDSLFEQNWIFTNADVSMITPIIPHMQYNAKISKIWLTHDCNKNEYNRAGYVITVQQMYHEYQHIQHQTKEWNATTDMNSVKNVNRMTDIVRRNFIRDYYDSAYCYNYAMDPSELDAEVYGLRHAFEYFKSDPLVTQDEAKEILFQLMMSEEYGHKTELDNYSIKSVDDMMDAFVDLRNTAVHKLYPITTESLSLIEGSTATEYDMTEEFLTSYKYRTHREELKKCTDGREVDKLLEQTIVMKYPDIGESVPRLWDELNKCRDQMQSRLLTPKHHAVPVSKINYAGLEDDFTDAVNKIPENADLKL